MGKQKIMPTHAKKNSEEASRSVSLPPGLVNHGNTCFMNSVLQGLIATRYLKDLFQFSPLSPSMQQSALIPIAAWRSPLLTNGHGLGGSCEQDWQEGMPIGDVFVTVMKKSWAIQQHQRKENISPKDLLAILGRKYDQYLDFRQQDAHEFLRQLLDAMRMEELDIIKQRQPPPSKVKRPRRPTMRSSLFVSSPPSPLAAVMNHSLFQTAQPDENKLISFADMLFGGKLSSILVCQKCKHISHTYEDFNDLSLSIKAEDYVRERKRDRLKNLAKKFKNLHGTALSVGLEIQRSSSVPASPTNLDEPPILEPRRRSLDVDVEEGNTSGADVDVGGGAEKYVMVSVDGNDGLSPVVELDQKGERLEFIEPLKAEKKDKKGKDDDGWARLGRRISMRVTKKPKDKDDQRSRSTDKRDRRSIDLGMAKEEKGSGDSLSFISSLGSATTISSPVPDGVPIPLSVAHQIPTESNRPKVESSSLSPPQPLSTTPALPSNRFSLISRVSSPIPGKRAKSPRPPKPTDEEAAYLKQVLADIIPASPNPFGIFRPPSYQGSGGNATNLLLKIGQLPGIEECLRLFTAVEVLDGENMVGCRRCWKIENGMYKPQTRPLGECEDSDSDESEKSQGPSARPDVNPDLPERAASDLERRSSLSSASASSSIASLDAQSDSTYNTPPSSLSNDAILPLQSHSMSKKNLPLSLSMNEIIPEQIIPESQLTTYGGMPIPVISTTAPESPLSSSTAANGTSPLPGKPQFINHSGLAEVLAAPLPVKDSLRAPKVTRHKRMPGDADSITDADESSDDALDSDASGSMLSDSSSVGSVAASPAASSGISLEQHPLVDTPTSRRLSAPTSVKIPRSKQVIMRPAFKRYLIATPPPVLVIHLKRFQQLSKVPVLSFSSGFKKLEDFVAFPELLDIGPFIAPRKEDFGLGKGSRLKAPYKRVGRCMYRLYAVVVHIGNMLGGHYVAYTALPISVPAGQSQSSDPSAGASSLEESSVSGSSKLEQNVPRKWAYISDTVVRLATLEEVLKAKAYICMYERI